MSQPVIIPGFSVLRELTSDDGSVGGMARVFKARRETATGRSMRALKVLREEKIDQAEVYQAFYRERDILSRISSRHVVGIYPEESSRPGQPLHGWHVLSLEWIEGCDLRHLITEEGVLSVERAVSLACDLLTAIEAVHDAGLVHCDVRPANIRLEAGTNRLVLLDLGIAVGHESDGNTRSVMGAMSYMSPEHFEPHKLVPASDLYCAGLVLYFMLTRRTPFGVSGGADAFVRAAMMHRSQPPPPPRRFNPRISADLEEVILMALAKSPSDRHASAAAFRDALLGADLSVGEHADDPIAAYGALEEATQTTTRMANESQRSILLVLGIVAAIVPIIGLLLTVLLWESSDPPGVPEPLPPVVAPLPPVVDPEPVSPPPAPDPEPPPSRSPEVPDDVQRLVGRMEEVYQASVLGNYDSFYATIRQRVSNLNAEIDAIPQERRSDLGAAWVGFWRFVGTAAWEGVVHPRFADPRFLLIARESVFRALPRKARNPANAARVSDSWGLSSDSHQRTDWPFLSREFEWSRGHKAFLTAFFDQPGGRDSRARILPQEFQMTVTRVNERQQRISAPIVFHLVPDGDFGPETSESLHTPFYMAEVETTLQWMRMFWAGRRSEPGDPDVPYGKATPEEAMEFCNWLSRHAGLPEVYEKLPAGGWRLIEERAQSGFRLPTADEWRYAARLGFDFGPAPLRPWSGSVDINLVHFRASEVRSSSGSPAYPVGVRDLLGNVRELVMESLDVGGADVRSSFGTIGGSFRLSEAAVRPSAPLGQVGAPDAVDDTGFRVILPVGFQRDVMSERRAIHDDE